MAITRKQNTTPNTKQILPKAIKKAAKAAKKEADKVKKSVNKLWDEKKVDIDQILSEVQYIQVEAINRNGIDFKTNTGTIWTENGNNLAKNLAQDSWSADHYEREVVSSMTELANIISNTKGAIFKAVFAKKLQADLVQQ